MRIDLVFTPQHADEMGLRDRALIVIDVLRASTTIATALQNGAREVIPVATVEAAVKISANLAGDVTLLAGERNARMIQGFHLGNSPLEFTSEKVRGKSIVFTSTNGALALAKGRLARELTVASFVNISQVTGHILRAPRDLTILCAGTNGTFSLEDAVCAGMIIHGLSKTPALELSLSDGALAAMALYKSYGKSIRKMLEIGEHGRLLMELGFGDDLAYCAGVDTVPVLPLMDGNVLKLKPHASPTPQP
ncbi:MAG TPA: 2-phosphosulfolactate phosphatase [Bacteroidota bacterium]